MVPIMASFGYASTSYDDRGMPDPVALPEAYEGVLWRRTLAYFVTACRSLSLALAADDLGIAVSTLRLARP